MNPFDEHAQGAIYDYLRCMLNVSTKRRRGSLIIRGTGKR